MHLDNIIVWLHYTLPFKMMFTKYFESVRFFNDLEISILGCVLDWQEKFDFFLHVHIFLWTAKKKQKKNMKCDFSNLNQTIFGGGLKCHSSQVFTAASQSGYSGCSNQIFASLLMQHTMIMSKPVTEMPRRIHTVTTAWNVTIYVTLDYKTSLKSLGYICSNSQNRLYESKWSIFLLCQK